MNNNVAAVLAASPLALSALLFDIELSGKTGSAAYLVGCARRDMLVAIARGRTQDAVHFARKMQREAAKA